MQYSPIRWGIIALATVVIGAPTVFYAAKGTPPRRATRSAVNTSAFGSSATSRKNIADRLGTCAKARTTQEKERCFARERQKCDQESSEKMWCVQRTLIGKLSGAATTCAATQDARAKRRCLNSLWKSDSAADRKQLTNVDRQETCAALTEQRDRDRCLLSSVRQGVRDGKTDATTLCAKIQDEDTRYDCEEAVELVGGQ